jgi:hypothetical protein
VGEEGWIDGLPAQLPGSAGWVNCSGSLLAHRAALGNFQH